jgi:hypothetical protein
MFDENPSERRAPSDPHSAPAPLNPSALDEPSALEMPPARPSCLPPSALPERLHLDDALRLWLSRGERSVRVRPVRCFPWSSPGELVSLRDEDDREELLVERLGDLDPASARALDAALLGSGFVLEIQRVESIEEDYEMRIWHTETRHGKRTFQTKLDEWPWAAPDGGHLVRDLAGDLFRVPPLHTLDEKSQKQLWAYVG